MTDDVISQATTPVTQTQEELSVLTTLVGEGRKYGSVDELAKSRIEADKFIEQLKFENQGMREALAELESKVQTSTTLDDVLKRINDKPEGERPNNQGGLDPESVRSLIKETLDNETHVATKATNRSQVNAELLQKFNGDAGKAKEYIVNRLKEVSMEPSLFKDLSESSPAAALRLLDINTTQAKGSTSPNTYANVSTDSPPVNPAGKRNQEYYTQLRKQMGTTKFFGDTKLQQQILKDVTALGQDFYRK